MWLGQFGQLVHTNILAYMQQIETSRVVVFDPGLFADHIAVVPQCAPVNVAQFLCGVCVCVCVFASFVQYINVLSLTNVSRYIDQYTFEC